MESLPKDVILEFNENTLYEVRELFDLHKPGAMKQAVEILEEWLKKQHHFATKEFDKHYLEKTIIVSKGSIEKAKARLDEACTLRTLMPHIFGSYDLRKIFNTDLKDINYAFLPKLTRNNERIYLFRNVGQKFEPTLMISYTRALNYMGEYASHRDYAASHLVIIDYREVNLTELATKLTISSMQELMALALECIGFRVAGVFILSASKLTDIVVTIFKQVLSSKIGQRIHVMKETEELHKFIDKDILPKEYGGNERPLKLLHEEWIDILMSEDHEQYMRYMNSARTNEELRAKDKFNEQYLGMPGTFRTLNVD